MLSTLHNAKCRPIGRHFFADGRPALLRAIVVIVAACALSGCGSIISRAVPGQGHGNQYYPGVQWDMRDGAWRYITVLDLPFSLVFDTLLLPIDASHGPYE